MNIIDNTVKYGITGFICNTGAVMPTGWPHTFTLCSGYILKRAQEDIIVYFTFGSSIYRPLMLFKSTSSWDTTFHSLTFSEDLPTIPTVPTVTNGASNGYYYEKIDNYINIWAVSTLSFTSSNVTKSDSTGRYISSGSFTIPGTISLPTNMEVNLTTESAGILDVSIFSISNRTINYYVSNVVTFVGVTAKIHLSVRGLVS